MKIRTLNELQDTLDRDFSWRFKEIVNMKQAIRTSHLLSQNTLIRAGVPLLYAHWEGFVKKATEAYIKFVSSQHHKYEELTSAFIVFGAKKHLQNLIEAKKAKVNIAAVDFFLTKLSEQATLSLKSAVNTEANLSSSVFENILLSISISPSSYEARYNFIDSSLLKRRNKIAHGESLDLDNESFKNLTDEVINILRDFKNDLEDSASSACYKR